MRRGPVLFVAVLFACAGALLPGRAQTAGAGGVVISQVYGAGNNSGAAWQNDYVELFNAGPAAVDLSTWSIQYTSSAGTAWGSNKVPLGGSLAPGHYYLVKLAGGTANGSPLPAADASGTINISGTTGKIALVSSTAGLPAAACPGDATLVDQVDYGSAASACRGNPTENLSPTTAAWRKGNGCTDSGDNTADFTVAPANPRNSAAPANACSGSSGPTGRGAANPAIVSAGAVTLLTVAVTPGANPASTGLSVSCDLAAIGGSAGQALYDDGSHGDAAAADNTFSWQATLSAVIGDGAKSLPCSLGDAQDRTGSAGISLAVLSANTTRIHAIQGASHVSPLTGQSVSGVPGIVTGLRGNGFYLQDPEPDGDPATSEGIFVFTAAAPAGVQAGDYVLCSGTVTEYRQGGNNGNNLTVTEIGGSPACAVITRGNALPAPVIIGSGSRLPPGRDIENDANGSVESANVFDPDADGIDFYESVEGMRVQVEDAQAVGPSQVFGGAAANREIAVVGDHGAYASGITLRGGIIIAPGDFNPERIILNDMLAGGPALPAGADVGDAFPGAIVGIMDYSYGNFKLQVATLPPLSHTGPAREVAPRPWPGQLSVSTFNVENLAATDPQAKFDGLAALFVDNLNAPDIVSVEEIQDNNGVTDDGTVDAGQTWSRLIAAIQAAGGRLYAYRQLDPLNDQDGGAAGGNIRQGFLFRPDRGVSFADRSGATAVTANSVTCSGGVPGLQYSPGRIDPANSAFSSSRKPLAGEFSYRGRRVFVVSNHFNSKGGDDPLFGRQQPPVFSSESQRIRQAQVVHDFVAQILACDGSAAVVVLGDLNDFPFSASLAALQGTPAILANLGDNLPANQRYSYVYEGNAEMLDHILVSGALAQPVYFAPLHVNAEFAQRLSDHDPAAAIFEFEPGAMRARLWLPYSRR